MMIMLQFGGTPQVWAAHLEMDQGSLKSTAPACDLGGDQSRMPWQNLSAEANGWLSPQGHGNKKVKEEEQP